MEALLALAIIALLGGVLIGGAQFMTDKPPSTHEVFWKAVLEARKAALKSEHDMRLKFDKEKKQFVLIDGLAPAQIGPDGFTREETPVKTFPVLNASAAELEVSFLSTQKGGPMLLLGGVMVEAQPLTHVTFYSDGTCSPFRVQFVRGPAVSTLSIDPWTCAPILTPADANNASI